MAYIGFNSNGYGYFSEGRYLLFTADNTHDYLFDYVNKDLSCLPDLFEQYISKRIDTTTLDLKKKHSDEYKELNKIKEILIDAHPYYKYEHKNVIVTAIGNYFNALILYLYYHKYIVSSSFSPEMYIEKITELLQPLLELGDNFPMDFYHKLINQIGNENSDPEAEIAAIDIPRRSPIGFSHELQTQRNTANMLYIILDIGAPELEQLTLSQRAWLHNKIYRMDYYSPEFNIPMQQSFCHAPKFSAGDRTFEQEQANKWADIFDPLYSLNNIDLVHDGIPSNMANYFSLAVELTKSQMVSGAYTEYQIDSLQQLLYLEIMAMIQSDTRIRKCRRCGKYFVVTNRKTAYCNRKDSSGLLCSAVGSQQNYQKKLKSDEALKIYNCAYKTHYARVKKGIMKQENFRLWYDEAKEKLAEVRNGKLTISDFQVWLKK